MTAVTEPKQKKSKSAEPLQLDEVTVDDLIVETVLPVDDSDDPVIEKVPPKPGEPGFDWSTEYEGEKFMVYTAKNGLTVGLAASKGRIKPGDFRRMSHMQDWQATFYMIEKIASPAALAVSDDFDDDEYSAMMTAWTGWANTSAGES